MNKKKFIYLSSFILLALMLFKVSAAHVYSHQDNTLDQIENCSICDSAIENQNVEFLSASIVSNESPGQIPLNSIATIVYEKQSFTSTLVRLRLFGRPPPALG